MLASPNLQGPCARHFPEPPKWGSIAAMISRLGIGGRLFAAFLGISALSLSSGIRACKSGTPPQIREE